MIQINLLPHREAAKKARKESFVASILLSAIIGGLLAGGVYLFFQNLIADQNSANNLIKQENQRLQTQIKEVDSIEAEIAALKARQQAVENLQSERNLPVDLMNELIKELPSGSYLTGMKKSGATVSLNGMAQSNQTVSDILNNISTNMPWNSKPQLVQSKAANINFSNDQSRRVFDYSINFGLNKFESTADETGAL